jgi:ABC-type nickel/cobalt efflux system permease component RcnA
MLSPEISVLISSAAVIAFVHTLMGPDHYLPFVSMALARRWSRSKMLWITAGCGLGHIAGSIALGLVGVALQTQLASLEWIESVRGDMAAWFLIAFGLVYFSWGMRAAYKNKPHSHWHQHGNQLHNHGHQHHRAHAHVHEQKVDGAVGAIGPWAVFIIFVLGPCEPLIPLLMYPAATESYSGLLLVTAVFGVVTMLTMLLAVFASAVGLQKIRLPGLEKYGHAMAGATLVACGSSIAFLGL